MKRIYPLESFKSKLLIPRLQRSVNIVAEEFPKPRLTRQTNEHEYLPHDLWLRWWSANAEEKSAILMEYEATQW